MGRPTAQSVERIREMYGDGLLPSLAGESRGLSNTVRGFGWRTSALSRHRWRQRRHHMEVDFSRVSSAGRRNLCHAVMPASHQS